MRKRRVSKSGFVKIGGRTWMLAEDWLSGRTTLTFATESPRGYLYVMV